MGFKISWVGVQGAGKEEVLAATGLRDPGEADEYNESPFSGADIPNDWFILFSNDFGFASPERLALISRHCSIVACQVHEGIMASTAFLYDRGECIWEIVHDAQNGPYDLSFDGSLPPQFRMICETLQHQQDKRGADVDYIFDIPVETAAAVCGFRYGRTRFDWGQPRFRRFIPE
jgi:hypothetical protein